MKYILILLLLLLLIALASLGYWLFKNQKNKLFDYFNSPEYSIEEIEKHNTRDSLWLHYEGHVYDVTDFISKHPSEMVARKDLDAIRYSFKTIGNKVYFRRS